MAQFCFSMDMDKAIVADVHEGEDCTHWQRMALRPVCFAFDLIPFLFVFCRTGNNR